MSDDTRVVWKGDRGLKYVNEVTAEALWLMGQDALTQAMPDVPLDTGTLRRSGNVTVNELPDPSETFEKAKRGRGNKSDSAKAELPDKNAARVYVSYSTPYAVKLHESSEWKPRDWRITASGKRVDKPAVGQWKWLARALSKVKQRVPFYVERAKRKVKVPK